jgi:hypothetical protein
MLFREDKNMLYGVQWVVSRHYLQLLLVASSLNYGVITNKLETCDLDKAYRKLEK